MLYRELATARGRACTGLIGSVVVNIGRW